MRTVKIFNESVNYVGLNFLNKLLQIVNFSQRGL
jgi:hypothetical protein